MRRKPKPQLIKPTDAIVNDLIGHFLKPQTGQIVTLEALHLMMIGNHSLPRYVNRQLIISSQSPYSFGSYFKRFMNASTTTSEFTKD